VRQRGGGKKAGHGQEEEGRNATKGSSPFFRGPIPGESYPIANNRAENCHYFTTLDISYPRRVQPATAVSFLDGSFSSLGEEERATTSPEKGEKNFLPLRIVNALLYRKSAKNTRKEELLPPPQDREHVKGTFPKQ